MAAIARQLLLDCRQLISSSLDDEPDIGPIPPAAREVGGGPAKSDGTEAATADKHHALAILQVEVSARLLAQCVAVECGQGLADRHTDKPSIPVAREVPAAFPERQCDVRGKTADKSVGQTWGGIGLVDDPWHASEPGREHGGNTWIAPHPEHDIGFPLSKCSERLHCRPDDREREKGKSPSQVRVEGQHVDGDELVASLWDEPTLESSFRTDEHDLGVGTRRADCIGCRKTRVDVAAGSASPNDDGRDGIARLGRVRHHERL